MQIPIKRLNIKTQITAEATAPAGTVASAGEISNWSNKSDWTNKSDRTSWTDKIISFVTYFLVFTLPLFFLPLTFEFYIFNKMFLLFFGVSLLLFLTLMKFLKNGELRIIYSPLDLFIALFLILAGVSAFLSSSSYSALFGFYGRFSGSFLEILFLVLFYFLILQNFYDKRERFFGKVIHLLVLANFLLVLMEIFWLFDLGKYIQSPVVQWARLNLISPLGVGYQGWAVYSAAFLVFLVGFLLLGKAKNFISKLAGMFYWFLIFANFATLLFIDFWASWFILLFGLLFLFYFAFARRVFVSQNKLLTLPIFLFLFSAVLLFFDFQAFWGLTFPREILLDPRNSFDIGWRAFLQHPILGSGPGNFWYDFTAFKGREFLNSPLWALRFSSSGLGVWEYLSTIGILGFASYVFLSSLFSYIVWRFLRSLSAQNSAAFFKGAVLFLGFWAFLLAEIFYRQVFSLHFYFWLFLVSGVIFWEEFRPGILRKKFFTFAKIPELETITMSVLIILILATGGIWWMAGRVYMADVNYRRALTSSEIIPSLEYLNKAVALEKNQEVYWRAFSQAHLVQINLELNKPKEKIDFKAVENGANAAVAAAKKATEIDPENAATWENLGGIYNSLAGAVEEGARFAESYFGAAIKLEPHNPFLYVRLSQAQIAVAGSRQELDKEKLNEALSNLEKAKNLKENYLGIHLNQAIALEKEGRNEEAFKTLKDYFNSFLILSKGAWQNPLELTNYFFQLGRFYYNNDELDKAAQNFIQAINITPLHSNSRFSLGLILEKREKIAEAIQQYEIVLQLNPDNKDLKKKIEELKQSPKAGVEKRVEEKD